MRLYSLAAAGTLLLLGITTATAQYGIYNGDFSITHGSESNINGCNYITSHYLPNWMPTHGTPNQIGTSIHMWYDPQLNGGSGEGIAGGYHFEPGITYEITVEATMPPPGGGASNYGTFMIYAATGLVEDIPTSSVCGIPIPSYMGLPTATTYTGTNPNGQPCQKELILNLSISGTNTYVFNYSPGIPNEQLWIYPYSTNNVRIEPLVNWVRIKACTNGSSITYTTPISPAGATHYASITAGGGSSGVLVNATPFQNTAYIGPDINLVPNFSAAFTGTNNHYFLALAIPDCGDTTNTGNPSKPSAAAAIEQAPKLFSANSKQVFIAANGESRLPAPDFAPALPAAALQIVPNPAREYIQITLPQTEGAAVVKITNAAGKEVFTSRINEARAGHLFRVNTGSFPQGLYHVRIISGKGSFEGKVIKL